MRFLPWLLVLSAFTGFLTAPHPAVAQPDPALEQLAGTQPLVLDEPLDVVMVRGINYFAERELADSPNRRAAKWNRDYSSPEAYQKSIEPNRRRLREIIGAVDERVANPEMYFSSDGTSISGVEGQVRGENWSFSAGSCMWEVLDGVHGYGIRGDGYRSEIQAASIDAPFVIVIPDADQTPEALFGAVEGVPVEFQIARRLAESGCRVLVPSLVSRKSTYSGHPDIRFTNQPHREFIYRMAFEMGRHVVGYEVQKVLAALDAEDIADAPVAVVGIGEGGLIAMLAAALDPRIDLCAVCGYFNERENVWREPIYRNIWSQLTEFGDAEIASLIAPRKLIIDAGTVLEVAGPPAVSEGRSGGAAPGRIVAPDRAAAKRESERAAQFFEATGDFDNLRFTVSDVGIAGREDVLHWVLKGLNADQLAPSRKLELVAVDQSNLERRQQRQVDELNRFTQRLMHASDKARDKVWAKVDRTNLDTATKSLDEYRAWVYDTLIGRLPDPTVPPNPRTRKVIDEPTHVGYEVVLDLFPPGEQERPLPQADGSAVDAPPPAVDKDFFAVGEDWGVIAGGILLIPKDLKPGEQRPVVVCQHGLEGTPMSTITTDKSDNNWNYYKGFATELCRQGFITYAPQNPYRGTDAFRHIQRKSNPMGRSLFSYIIPQHKRTLEFLATLPYVDPERIAFYGLSYGGKTAVRVPPILAEGQGERVKGQEGDTNSLDPQPSALSPGYCLSICSADYNDWVRKNASSEDRYSYVFTGEYEIFEWNMGHVANYAELSYLMTPRPFMVERGHNDGVAPDEWVAWEFAKVKRHYDQLGIGDRTELEVFNGPHTINGVGTYDFLHRHLNWPAKER